MDVVGVRAVRTPGAREELALRAGSLLVGGGTWVYSEARHPGADELVDLLALGWEPLEVLDDGSLRIAATCPIADLVALPSDPRWHDDVPAIMRLAAESLLMSWKIWPAATVGGNLCLALPAGAMTGLLVALDGEAVVWQAGTGERRIPVAEFVRGVQQTALRPGEVLRAIEVPRAALAARHAHRRASLAPLGRSGALLIARRDESGAVVLSLTAATAFPRRLWFPTLPSAAELAAAVDAAVGPAGWFDDPHGAPAWRRSVTLMLAEEIRQELS